MTIILIDADAYIKYCDDHWIVLNIDALDAQPTIIPFNIDIDAIPVVKCRDCKFNKSNYIPGEDSCLKFVDLPITKDFYCARGEWYVG